MKAVCRSAVACPKISFAARRPAIHYKTRGEPPINHLCAGIHNWRLIGRGPSPVARGPRVALRPTSSHGETVVLPSPSRVCFWRPFFFEWARFLSPSPDATNKAKQFRKQFGEAEARRGAASADRRGCGLQPSWLISTHRSTEGSESPLTSKNANYCTRVRNSCYLLALSLPTSCNNAQSVHHTAYELCG